MLALLFMWVLLPMMTATVWIGAAFGELGKALALVVLVMPLLAIGLVVRRRRGPRWVWVSLLVVAGAFGACVFISATLYGAPSAEELAAEAGRIGVPEGWVLIDEEIHDGSPVCFGTCPGACREYRTPNDPAEAVDELRPRFDEAGYATKSEAPELSSSGFVGRAWHRTVRALVETQRMPPDYRRSEQILQLCLEGHEVP